MDHVLQPEGHHAIETVEKCGVEVGNYLCDISNWPQPIFPDVNDCSRLEIMPSYFNISGTFWKCSNQMDEGKTETYKL